MRDETPTAPLAPAASTANEPPAGAAASLQPPEPAGIGVHMPAAPETERGAAGRAAGGSELSPEPEAATRDDLAVAAAVHPARLVVITGVSGSGKSTALKSFEDMGFYCVDNLPSPLMPHFAELILGANGWLAKMNAPRPPLTTADRETSGAAGAGPRSGRKQLALLVDCRHEHDFGAVQHTLELLHGSGVEVLVLFFESHDDVIIRRFRETRRPHPMLLIEPGLKTIHAAIRRERELLAPFRERATKVIDSSVFSPHDLRRALEQIFDHPSPLELHLVSFGFKYGAPHDADLIVDVRFLPNPHFVPALQPWTGEAEEVKRYIFANGDADQFLERYVGLLEFLLPRYRVEGKRYVSIGVGCTGGMHRSVALALAMKERLQALGYAASITHRDLTRGA